jgi:acetolactate synthase small subunit
VYNNACEPLFGEKEKAMRQTSFVVDEKTEKALEDLKETFGVSTNAAVIRRALALAKVAAENADSEHTITILDKSKREQKVLLAG